MGIRKFFTGIVFCFGLSSEFLGVCKSISNPVTKQILIDFVRLKAQKPSMAKTSLTMINGVVSSSSSSNGSSETHDGPLAKKRKLENDTEDESMPPPMYVPSTKH